MALKPAAPSELTTALNVTEEIAPAALGLHPALVVRTPAGTRVVDLPTGTALSVGRAEDNDIVVDDARVSRRLARIESRPTGLFVVDLGSRNGIRVGATRVVGEQLVRPGDLVSSGPLEILVAGASAVRALPRPDTQPSGAGLPRGVIVAEPSMVALYRTVRRLSSLETTVLISGETGAGKEVVAQQLHASGSRAAGPFVSINAAAMPDTLLEATLFGHERGAFTGAEKKRPGVFLEADQGTLFLDEIGEMPLGVQVKLLRVLETRTVKALGATQETPFDVRIVAATHRDLRAEVKAGRFREDLLFRISTFVLTVPPLRERPGEIALLAAEFAAHLGPRHGFARVEILPATFDALRARAWPGNVRELRNAIEHALVLAEDGVVRPEHLPPGNEADGGDAIARPSTPPSFTPGIRDKMAEAERLAIEAALRENDGNQSATARKLGISRRALLYKMEKYAIKIRRELE
jgi:two-component system, NtrC family, response regulator AtoC